MARVDERPNDLPHCAHLYERSAATSRRPGDDVIDDVAGDAADDDGTLAATEAESTDDGDDDSEAGREMAEEAEDTAAAAATTCSYGFQMRGGFLRRTIALSAALVSPAEPPSIIALREIISHVLGRNTSIFFSIFTVYSRFNFI